MNVLKRYPSQIHKLAGLSNYLAHIFLGLEDFSYLKFSEEMNDDIS